MLFQAFLPDAKAYFVLDGLDECDKEEKDAVVQALQKIQERFTVAIPTLPDTIDPATYSKPPLGDTPKSSTIKADSIQ